MISEIYNLNALQWLISIVCAFMIGLTKTGIPGLGVLISPLMADVFLARASTGIVLPMLIFADLFAIIYYRRDAVWSHLLRILPWTALGIVLGYLLLGRINDNQLRPFIGTIILVILAVKQLWDRREDYTIPTQWWFAGGLGVIAGITTMIANAAGPFSMIYLLSMRLQKKEFIGTVAWFYFILNWFKAPFSYSLGLLNNQSLQFDLVLFPIISVGAVIGIIVLKHIPDTKFEKIVMILAAAAAIKLLFS